MLRIVSTLGAALVLAALSGCTAPAAPAEPEAAKPSASQTPAEAVPEAPAVDPTAPVSADATAVKWAATMFPVFDTITESGSGAGSYTLPAGVTAGTYTMVAGDDNTIASVTVNGVDGIGTLGSQGGLGPEFSGVFGVEAAAPAAAVFVIAAETAWTLTIKPISTLPGLPGAGMGFGAFLYAGAADTPVKLNAGSSNMLLQQYTDSVVAFVTPDGTSEGASGTLVGTPSLVTVDPTGSEWTLVLG